MIDGREAPASGRSFGRKSNNKWALRSLLALLVAVMAFLSVRATLANVAVNFDPAQAYALSRSNGYIASKFAEYLFNNKPQASPNSPSALIAQKALLDDPTAVSALNVLGLQAQLRLDVPEANRIFGYSISLSRRELQPQLWAIQNAVTRGDISEALLHYDVAMRVSDEARTILFPILTHALAEQRVQVHLIKILKQKPDWMNDFIAYAASSKPNAVAVMNFFRSATRAGLPVKNSHRVEVVTNLIASGNLEDAWTYYVSFRHFAPRDSSRDPNFSNNLKDRTPFDWVPSNEGVVTASIVTQDDHGELQFAAPPATRATIVTQVELLPPGAYRFSGVSRGVNQPSYTAPYWTLTCRGGQEIGRLDLPNSSISNGHFATEFTVPRNCLAQDLSLVVKGTDQSEGVTGQILQAQLTPVAK